MFEASSVCAVFVMHSPWFFLLNILSVSGSPHLNRMDFLDFIAWRISSFRSYGWVIGGDELRLVTGISDTCSCDTCSWTVWWMWQSLICTGAPLQEPVAMGANIIMNSQQDRCISDSLLPEKGCHLDFLNSDPQFVGSGCKTWFLKWQWFHRRNWQKQMVIWEQAILVPVGSIQKMTLSGWG